MYKTAITIVALFLAAITAAQQRLQIKVLHADTREPLPEATVQLDPAGATSITDREGIAVFSGLFPGKYKIRVSYVEFVSAEKTIHIPYSGELEIYMEPSDEQEEEVIIQSTRTSRNIKNVPTRVEMIELEEIDEKNNMRPANVSMLLHESTGILVQQTSATSANASIRLQGLDGRYTQLLKDGFASFGNFASGLSVLEIPPLDLKQVEIIKGPASTLFGGGAIAGVINFISKTPGDQPTHSLLLNQSHIGQTNLGYFTSARNKKTGYTLLGLVNHQLPYDVDKDDFTELPKSVEFTVHPKLFLYLDKNRTWVIGNSFTKGNRKGGDMERIKGQGNNYHVFFEENNTIRNITTIDYQQKTGESATLVVKQGFSVFDRHISIPDYHFDGISYNSFTDISMLAGFGKHAFVSGGTVIVDFFNEKPGSAGNRDNKNFTTGLYVQDTWDISAMVKLESGLRVDYARYKNKQFANHEFFVLPRVSLLLQYNHKLSSRIGAGMGYKLPTLFTERTESYQYQGIRQLNNVVAEKSYGGTADLNFRTKIGNQLTLAFNQMFFLTSIVKPLILQEDISIPEYYFINAAKPVNTFGFETNAKFIFKSYYKLFLGYTYTNANAKYLPGNQFLPLVPAHKLNAALIYEKHKVFKIGLEAYYTGVQFLYDGTKTPDFWEFGLMAEKPWKYFSLYINFENFTDTRQSRYKTVANGNHQNPAFDDIWTHTEGFIVNGGIKINL